MIHPLPIPDHFDPEKTGAVWRVNYQQRAVDVKKRDPALVQKVCLLEDCTSPVVIPGVVDYSESADKAFERFADAGMHRVSTDLPIEQWPGIGNS